MNLKFRVLSGPKKGEVFEVTEGLVIGRSRTDVALNDPKVSSKHAKIKISNKKQWFIEDLGSTNGLKLGGKKVHQVPLEAGVRVVLGSSELEFFEEIDLDDSEPTRPRIQKDKLQNGSPPPLSQARQARMVEPEELEDIKFDPPLPITNPNNKTKEKLSTEPLDIDAPPQDMEIEIVSRDEDRTRPIDRIREEGIEGPAEISMVVEEESWQEFFSNFISDIRSKIGSPNNKIQPFSKVVQLYFKKGIQVDQSWTLGYGPRTAGSKSLDIPILESNAPHLCFVLRPQHDGVLFSTPNPGTVQLNKKPLDSEILEDGDIISIYNTEIQVSFLNEES